MTFRLEDPDHALRAVRCDPGAGAGRLELLTAIGGGLAPRLLAVGDDPRAADEALTSWADTVARLHAATAGRGGELTMALTRTAARPGP